MAPPPGVKQQLRTSTTTVRPTPTVALQRIAFVCNDALTLDLFRGNIIRTLLGCGFEVHVIAPFDAHAQQLIAAGALFTAFEIETFSQNLVREMLIVAKLRQIYRQLRPQLLFHYTIKINIYGTHAARRLNIPCVNVAPGLGSFPDVQNPVLRAGIARGYAYAARRAYEFWFLNLHDYGFFESRGWLAQTQARILPGEGVDTTYYRPAPQKSAADKLRVLFIGRLLETKGARVFAEAAQLAQQADLPMEFSMLGFLQEHNPDGIPARQLQSWVNSGSLRYLGAVDDVLPLLQECDVVVMPTHFREGLNRVILEAMSCGVPVVTTAVPGAGELVEHDRTGYIVPTKNPAAVVAALQHHAVKSNEQKQLMGSRARQLVIQKYDQTYVLQHYFDVIRRLGSELRQA